MYIDEVVIAGVAIVVLTVGFLVGFYTFVKKDMKKQSEKAKAQIE